jgi:hypothetical protein
MFISYLENEFNKVKEELMGAEVYEINRVRLTAVPVIFIHHINLNWGDGLSRSGGGLNSSIKSRRVNKLR